MSQTQPLHGSCNCGRNEYTILLPTANPHQAQLFIDDSTDDRSSHPIPYLRIPLSWYHSQTTSFFPDETHSNIRRIFTPQHTPHVKRIFCGLCGTHLSYWSEEPVEEAEFLSIPVGSLRSEDVRKLDELGLLPEAEDENSAAVDSSDGTAEKSTTRGHTGGMSWLEEMVDRSYVWRTSRTRKGKGVSADGSTTVEWEISEYREGESDSETSNTTGIRGKRKIGEVGGASGVDTNKELARHVSQ